MESIAEAIVFFLVSGGIAAAIGVALRGKSRDTLMPRARKVRIRDVQGGELVRIVGFVRTSPNIAPLVAPLTARECVAFHVRFHAVEQLRWAHVDYQVVPFTLDDGTGTSVIDPANAEIRWSDQVPEVNAYPADAVERLRARHPGVITASEPARFMEQAIDVGAWIAVQGVTELMPDVSQAALGYREAQPTKIRFVARPGQPLYLNLRHAATGTRPSTNLVRKP
jgi:hypothetical protein